MKMMDVNKLRDEAQRIEAAKQDYIVPPSKITLLPSLEMDLDGIGALGVNDYAHGQISQTTGVPKVYYDRMKSADPELLAQNVNRWMREVPEDRMVRTLDGTVRALVSNRFKPYDNMLLLEGLNEALPGLAELEMSIVSCNLSEKYMHLQFASPKVSAEVKKGDIVYRGITISNSEVGAGAVRLEAFLYRLVCLNGMITGESVRKNHVGRRLGGVSDGAIRYSDDTLKADQDTFRLMFRDSIKHFFNPQVFEAEVHKLTEASERPITGDVEKTIKNVTKRYGLTQSETDGTLKNLVNGCQGAGATQWGLSNAITEIAAKPETPYDRAIELQRAGGDLANLTTASWNTIQKAAA